MEKNWGDTPSATLIIFHLKKSANIYIYMYIEINRKKDFFHNRVLRRYKTIPIRKH